MPTLSAQLNTQVWYGSSAGLPTSDQLGRIWRRIRRAVDSGIPDPSLAGFEWAAEICTQFCPAGCTDHDRVDDRAVWARTNPALNLRHANGTMLTEAAIESEFLTLSPAVFARERLSVGEYPSEDDGSWAVIPERFWLARRVARPSLPSRPVVFAADASPGQVSACITVASWLPGGDVLVEIPDGDCRPDIGWVVPRLLELRAKYRPVGIVVDPQGPAAGLIPELERGGVEVVKPTASESAAAFAQFTTGVLQSDGVVRHLGQDQMAAALKGATVRDSGDGAKRWARRDTTIDISPLVSATYAQWFLRKHGRSYDLLKSIAGPS